MYRVYWHDWRGAEYRSGAFNLPQTAERIAQVIGLHVHRVKDVWVEQEPSPKENDHEARDSA